ncbi:hypothetical protein EAJ14_03665 [Parabacteroides distasonis]|jgi:hypothetical protein|nr:hypothetical protein DW814_10200 [Parabacteroides distasonis]RHM51592.1 hypothetical protein DWZ58_19560 [Parabacteroides distasonis]RYS77557.1 hypothetical protein EAJ14_03665 [Parabacteroides distasonis]
MTMKAERQHKEATSRVIRTSDDHSGHILDNRSSYILQAKTISEIINNRKTQNIVDNISIAQFTIDKDYKTRINDLATLNIRLAALVPVVPPIQVTSFGIPTLTLDILNDVIKKDNNTLYDGITQNDVLDFYLEALQIATTPPVGYERCVVPFITPATSIYIKNLDYINKTHLNTAIQHLNGRVFHKSTEIKGATKDDIYLHTSKSDGTSIYLITDDGEFLGCKKYTIVKQGKVSDGLHDFS